MYFLWQTATYGDPLDPERPATLYRARAIPCTPAGDPVAEVARPADHPGLVRELGLVDADRARAILAGRPGITLL